MPDRLTPAGEDCLAMITELSLTDGNPPMPVRIGELAEKLGVSPSSASRMAQMMAGFGYVDFRRYGYILLTECGRETGMYFLYRRKTVHRFLSRLTGRRGRETEEETARIEHGVSRETVEAMEKALAADADFLPVPSVSAEIHYDKKT